MSNTFWIIIAAILGLVVLVVLVAIFTGRIQIFQQEVESCALKGGRCQDDPCSENAQEVSAGDCSAPKHCCVQLFGT